MAMGTDESRAALAQFYSQLDNAGKRAFLVEVAKAHPPATGHGLSASADKIMRVATGRGLPDEALKASEAASVGKGRTTAEKGVAGGDPYVADNPTDEFVDIDDPNAINYQGAEEIDGPSPLMRRDLPPGYDPKQAKAKDPNTDKATSSIDNRPRLRTGEKTVEVIDNPETGKPKAIIYGTEGKGAIGSQDIKPISQGKEYDAAVEANVAFQRDALLQEFGSQEGIAQAIRAAEENPEIQAVFDRVKAQASKAHPIPPKPYPVADGAARASERSAQNDYDGHIRQLVYGRPNSPIYKEVSGGHPEGEIHMLPGADARIAKRGTSDPLQNVIDEILIRSKDAGPENLDPIVNRRFNSPEELAAALIRNASPEMFDMPPVTPGMRMDAEDIVRGLEPKYPKTMLEAFGFSMRQGDRQGLMQQAEAQLADVIRKRYGDQWGANYKPGPASDLEPAPEFRVPEPGVGTSQDLADIPAEMGRPNTQGTPNPPKTPEEYAQEFQDYRRAVSDKGYMGDDAPLASPPTKNFKKPDYSQPEGTTVDPELNDLPPEELAEARGNIRDNRNSSAARAEAAAKAAVEGQFKPGRYFPDEKEPPQKRAWADKPADQQHKESYSDSDAYLADYNELMRDIPDTDQARRAAFAQQLEGVIDVDTARSADIRREIAEIEAQMQENAGLNTPEKEARLAELRDQLRLTTRLDQLSGIRSHAKPTRSLDDINAELGGMDDAPVVDANPTRGQAVDVIPRAKERAEKAIADLNNKRVGDKRRAAAAKVIDQLEKQGKALKGEQAARFEAEVLGPARKALADSAIARAGRKPQAEATPDPAAKVEDAVEADQIDPLESAATELDEAPAPGRNAEQPPRVEAEAEAAATVEAKKAPEDAEATRPAKESSTIADEKSKTPRDRSKGSWLGTTGRAVGLGIGGLGGWMALNALNRVAPPSMDEAWSTKPEGTEDPNAVAVDTQSGMLADPAMSGMLADPQQGSADRIRAMQRLRMPELRLNSHTQIPGQWNR